MRHAANPDMYGADMLVPALISFPVSNPGTVEKAQPGASRSGFANRPPRPLNDSTKSVWAGGAPSSTSGT